MMTTATTVPHHATQRTANALFWWGGLFMVLWWLIVGWAAADDVEGTRAVIRATARSSLLCFLLAYTASAMAVVWPGGWRTGVRAHRRTWGWLLVLSHSVHGMAILHLGHVAAPDLFASLTPLGSRVSGGLGYLILGAMGATSFDLTAHSLGPKRWKWLHAWGSHYLWLSFMVANSKRIVAEPWHALPLVLLMAAIGLRWWVALRR